LKNGDSPTSVFRGLEYNTGMVTRAMWGFRVGEVLAMSKARSRHVSRAPAAPPRTARRRFPEPQWRAWSNDGERILAVGPSFGAARDAARAMGEMDPIVEPAPPHARLA
jgi:hypothetical protein